MKTPKLDAIDIRILALLQKEGRLTNQKLAETIGLSASPSLERVKRLESAGYIKRYGAVLDVEKLYGAVTVFAEIALKEHGAQAQSRFEKHIKTIEEAVECFEISGKQDYIARFVCRDVNAYQELTSDLLENPKLGINQISSRIVLRRVKEFSGFPLAKDVVL